MAEKSEDNIVIEVLDSSEVPENELKYFEETQPLEIKDIILEDVDESISEDLCTDANIHVIREEKKRESEEILIQKYVNGEVAFNDFYTSLGNDDDEDEEILSWEQDTKSETDNSFENDENKCSRNEASTSSGSHFIQKDMKTVQQKQQQQRQQEEQELRRDQKFHRKRSILTTTLQGLMGEANLSFVRGKIDIAEKICLEIIRQNPLASEPFFTLAQIYETRDEDKFLEFLTIAAHLDPTNRDQWIRIAELNIEKEQYSQAKICYSKAIKFFPKDYELRIMKSKLFQMIGNEKHAMFTLMKMISILPPEKYEYCLTTAKNVAKYFYKLKNVNYALEAMQSAYKVAGQYFSPVDINLYLELLIINKFYHKVLLVLKSFAKIEYITETENDNNDDNNCDEISVVACVFPDDMLTEYRIKACVCLVHLKAFHLISYLMNNMFEFVEINTNIEGYIDVAEAMMQEEKFAETLEFLEKVIENADTTIPPYVWLRYAECHFTLGNATEAISSYQKVVELAPFCYDAKFTLSTLLKAQGKHKEAIKALEQDLDAETFNPRILLEYCLMLKTVGEIDQYIEGGYILLARNSLKFRTREEMLQASAGANHYKSSTIKSIVEWRLDGNKKDDEPILNTKNDDTMLSIDEEYDLFKDLLKLCYEKRKYGMMQKLCFAMITSKRFRTKFKELEKLIILTSLYNDDPLISFMFLREILSRNPQKKIYWNIANQLIQKYDSVRYYRYFKRLLDRITTESYFKIFLANYHLSAGSYKYALNLYVSIFKDTNDPLVALCITIVFSQMSTQKNSLKRQTAAAQAIAFARKYSELRLSSVTEQEVYYNLGRIYHHTGLLHIAIQYYTKALEIENEMIKNNEKIMSLREETAFNLHLIYKTCGNYDMARKYLYKYIIV